MPKIYKRQLRAILKSLTIIDDELVKIRQGVIDLLHPFRIPDRNIKKVLSEILPVMEVFLITERTIAMFPPIYDKAIQPLLTIGEKKLGFNIDWERAKRVLSDRELKILELRRDGITLEKVGVQFSLTRERIRQIEKEAIDKLRGISNNANYRSIY